MNNCYKICMLICITAFFVFGSQDDTSASTSAAVSKSTGQEAGTVSNDTLEVTARLVEIPGKFPPNDAYSYVYIMKYRVLSVEKGTYKERELYVGHYNPLIPRKLIKDKMDKYIDGTVEEFKIGDKHRLKLVEPIEEFFDQKEDEYYDTELPKYFAVKADLVN